MAQAQSEVNNHSDNTVTVSVPGKLFLAGEYAVVHSGQAAIITTVDAFLHLSLRPVEGNVGHLTTNQADHAITWHYDHDGRVVSEDAVAEEFPLLWQAIQTVNLLAIERGIFSASNPPLFDIEIKSELDAADGTKYGLGSSGAVSVALVSALMTQYDLYKDLTESQRVYQVYKLVAITQYRLGMMGSLGDVAASAHTGVIYYQNFDRDWFDAQAKETGADIVALLNNIWPDLMIEPLPIDPDWTLSVVWTKEKASTEELLKLIPEHVPETELAEILKTFKQYAKLQVLMAKAAIQMNDWKLFKSAISDNYDTILHYTRALDKPYLTKSFKKAISLVTQDHSVAKISGAGAGDCAYAISNSPASADQVQAIWRNNALVVLPFAFWERTHKE